IAAFLQTRLPPREIVLLVFYRKSSPVPAESPKLAIPQLSTCWAQDWKQSHRDVENHSEESEEIQHLEALSSHTPTRSTGLLEGLAEFVVLPPTPPGI